MRADLTSSGFNNSNVSEDRSVVQIKWFTASARINPMIRMNGMWKKGTENQHHILYIETQIVGTSSVAEGFISHIRSRVVQLPWEHRRPLTPLLQGIMGSLHIGWDVGMIMHSLTHSFIIKLDVWYYHHVNICRVNVKW